VTTAVRSSTRTTAASSPSSTPTKRSDESNPPSPLTICSSSSAGILQAHPPPWAYCVNRYVASLSVITRSLALLQRVVVHRRQRSAGLARVDHTCRLDEHG